MTDIAALLEVHDDHPELLLLQLASFSAFLETYLSLPFQNPCSPNYHYGTHQPRRTPQSSPKARLELFGGELFDGVIRGHPQFCKVLQFTEAEMYREFSNFLCACFASITCSLTQSF